MVSQLRALIGELRPAGLEELGLPAALEGYVARLQREGGASAPAIALDLVTHGRAIPGPVAYCLFRVAQEAVRNAVRHARARRVTVSLRVLRGVAVLGVRDDGCGFDLPASLSEYAHADHYGLVGMAERIAWVGGQFVVHSQPGEGTDLTAWVPLAPGRDGLAGSNGHHVGAPAWPEARVEIAQPRAVPLGPGAVP